MARKLAALLHSLWMSAEVYEPLRKTPTAVEALGGLKEEAKPKTNRR